MWSGRRLGFFLDEWDFVLGRRTGGVDDYLKPHFEHIVVVAAFIYKALFATVGLSSYWPYRAVLAIGYVGSATMVYVLAGRRVGPWAALAAGALVLFAGRTNENMIWAFEIAFVGSVLCGLIALWAIQDLADRRRVVLTAAMLVLGTLFSSLGLPFAAGVAAELAWQRRWKLLWVPAVAVVIYGAWYFGYGVDAETTRAGPIDAAWWGLRCAVAGLAAVFGLPQAWGWPLLAAFGGFAAWRLPRTGVSPRIACLAVLGIVYWGLVGMGRAADIPVFAPSTSRYLLVGIVVYVLLACELLVGIEIKRPQVVAIATTLVVAVSALLGFADMTDDANARRQAVSVTNAELTALELGAKRARRDYIVDGLLAPEILAGPYLDSARDAAKSDIPETSPKARTGADRVLREVAVILDDVPAAAAFSSCRRVPADQEIAVRSGERLKLVATRRHTRVAVRRFAGRLEHMGGVAFKGTLFDTVADTEPTPYRIAFSAPVRVCR
jgi:hypothetical protein